MSDFFSMLGQFFNPPSPTQGLQEMQQNFGMVNPGDPANVNAKTPLVLSPENYQKMETLKKDAGSPGGQIQNFFDAYKKQQEAANKNKPQQAQVVAPGLTPMPAPGPLPQIPQQDLMGLLALLGGGNK